MTGCTSIPYAAPVSMTLCPYPEAAHAPATATLLAAATALTLAALALSALLSALSGLLLLLAWLLLAAAALLLARLVLAGPVGQKGKVQRERMVSGLPPKAGLRCARP